MNTRSRIFLAVVVVAAICLTAVQPWIALSQLSQDDWLGIACLTALGLLAELRVVQFSIGSTAANASIHFIAQFATVILFPGPAAVLTTIATVSFGQFFIHKRGFLRGLFNVAQVTFATCMALIVFHSLGGVHGENLKMLPPLSFAGLAVTFFFANQLVVSVMLALLNGGKVGLTFARIASGAGANLAYDVLVSPLAYIVVLVYAEFNAPGLFFVVLPMILIRSSYLEKQKVEQANKDILQVLVKTIETRDPYTSGHSKRVANLARAIAEDLDLLPAKVEEIHSAGMVHDIGKIDEIYSEIIRKDSGLSDAERRIIVTHAAKGAEFLETLSSFRKPVIAGVRHHHERYDGSGYPDRLKGDAIPLAARIIMLCDSIDAMLSNRPYRSALTIEKVRAELLRCSGSQFDPEIVKVILERQTLERAASLAVSPTAPRPLAAQLSVAV